HEQRRGDGHQQLVLNHVRGERSLRHFVQRGQERRGERDTARAEGDHLLRAAHQARMHDPKVKIDAHCATTTSVEIVLIPMPMRARKRVRESTPPRSYSTPRPAARHSATDISPAAMVIASVTTGMTCSTACALCPQAQLSDA